MKNTSPFSSFVNFKAGATLGARMVPKSSRPQYQDRYYTRRTPGDDRSLSDEIEEGIKFSFLLLLIVIGYTLVRTPDQFM